MMEDIISGREGFDETYGSESEFKEQLKLQMDLSSQQFNGGWVFWRYEQLESLNFPTQIIKDKIQRLLEEFASKSWAWDVGYVVQFWAAEVNEQQQVYLTTSDQPFAVSKLSTGLSWYRHSCMAHRYRVDKGAGEDELGAVGRVYRNKHPESSPDLRLYSIEEFPLRNYAARSGLRSYYALPVFDLLDNKCYGVIEASSYGIITMLSSLGRGLKVAELRTTHVGIDISTRRRPVHIEIKKMVELAVEVMPQLRMAQVWVPCPQCSNNLTCFQTAYGSSYSEAFLDKHIGRYLYASKLHNLQITEDTNPIAKTVMSSNHMPCICPNICDLSITENPLAHYAQKARLSFCFAICLRNTYNSRDIYLVEFYLQFNSGEDTVVGSFLKLLLSIMERELKSFDFADKGHHGKELVVVEVAKENVLSSNKSRQSNAVRYKSLKYKHEDVEDLSRLMVMEGFEDEYALSDFMKYLQKPDLRGIKPCTERGAWVFWSEARADNSKLSIMSDTIQEKIKCLMRELTFKWSYYLRAIAQFWAAKKDDMNRCYLETSDQPFAVCSLRKGIASLRKQCMEHKYYVDDAAKGPPGRVFLNGHQEISPDLRLYSTTEFPLRNHAARSSLRQYYALPIFERNQQHICVGVLELLLSRYSYIAILIHIGDALMAADLSSTHMNFNPSARRGSVTAGNNMGEGWELALTEMEEACQLFTKIPQVFMTEVWVPNNECATINTKLSCMERMCFTTNYWYLDSSKGKLKHVEGKRSITGMTLASENMSCFSLNLSAFGIAEPPHSHYAQVLGLDVCFAICLQSGHTGDVVYVLEFYLYQAPRKSCKYLSSFLCLLLPLLKQKLTSFKVASGQQLGDKLVVEVIDFSQPNDVDVVELDRSDGVPITFKFVNYQGQKQSQDHKHDVQLAPDDVMEQYCSKSTTNLKKKESAKETQSQTRLNITLSDLQSHFGRKRKDAAKELGVSISTFKRACKRWLIHRWPHNEKYKKNPSLFMTESANQSGRDSQPNMNELPNNNNFPPPDIPQTDPKSSQHLMTQPKVDMVVIYANYENKTIKFKLCHTAGMKKLVNEVAIRLKLEVGTFEMEYLDEINKMILLTCDVDLEFCLESLAADEGKYCYIEIFVKNSAVISKPYIQVFPSSTPPPSSSVDAYIHHFPSYFHRYILSIKNVVGDGHCGFRVVANLLGFGEESWARVRHNLIDELRQNHQLYTSVFIKHGAVEEVLQILMCFDERTSNAHWFTLPEMGYLVASTYNVALVSLSTTMCSTFLPLRTTIPCNLKCICIGLVNNDHFVQVFLRDGHPIPSILLKWHECHYPDAATWSSVYTQQLKLYNSISGNNDLVLA